MNAQDDPRQPPESGHRAAPDLRHEPDEDRIDVRALHSPIMQENVEPEDGYEPVSIWLIFLFLALVGWGGWYVGNFNGGWDSTVYNEDPLARAGGVAMAAGPVDPMVLGKRVFNRCIACHQADGRGLPGSYPPLAASEIVLGAPQTPVRIVLHGLEGPITVAGQTYHNLMPPWGAMLSDEEVAAVVTYIRQSWGNAAAPVEAALVAQVRELSADRVKPWTMPELAAAAQHDAAAPAPATAAVPLLSTGDTSPPPAGDRITTRPSHATP